jgi:hypothetical protein
MQKHQDGSVTLSKRELADLNKAYQKLRSIIAGGPSFLGDYFDTQKDYLRVEKWKCQLSGNKFDITDYQ